MNRGVYLAALALGLAVLIYAEWHTDEVTVILALLLALSAGLGFLRPARALGTGFALGLAILVAHAGSFLTGLYSPAYQGFPPSGTDWLVMACLVLPALAAAYAGAWARRAMAA
jgi:hypothetical protein